MHEFSSNKGGIVYYGVLKCIEITRQFRDNPAKCILLQNINFLNNKCPPLCSVDNCEPGQQYQGRLLLLPSLRIKITTLESWDLYQEFIPNLLIQQEKWATDVGWLSLYQYFVKTSNFMCQFVPPSSHNQHQFLAPSNHFHQLLHTI